MSEKKIVAEAKTGDGTVIEINLPEIDKTIQKLVEESPKLKEYFEELKEYKAKKAEGKGVIETMKPDSKTRLIEQLQHASKVDIIEQWTVTIPAATAYELGAHMRDYVFVSEVMKGEQGEIIHIPYVKDFDFVDITPEADSLTEASSIISTMDTVLHEAGRYANVPYGDIEMIDSNLLDELNSRFANAAVRAEDAHLISLIGTHATSVYGGEVNYAGTETGQAFYAKYIPKAIGKLLKAGKDVHPGELVLYMTARPYAALLEELVASQAFTYPRGDVVKSGALTEYLGVKIVVGAEVEGYYRTTSTTTGTYEQCFLMRAKRALCLAPKRDLLIETDKNIKTRVLQIVGSHTFGVVEIDPLEVCRIVSNQLTT